MQLHERVKGRLVLFIGDFTPLEYRPYFERMAELIELRGVAFLQDYSPILGLLADGRYEPVPDRRHDSPREVHEYLLEVYDKRSTTP